MVCQNRRVLEWVDEVAKQLTPDKVVWVDGSESEYVTLCNELVSDGVFIPLNAAKYPGCYLSRSHPSDVARVEDRTFICSRTRAAAGPTNNWAEPQEMYRKLNGILEGCMKGRTMYVIPYLMGPDGSPYSKVGFEITDSRYVIANMRIMARIGDVALKNLSDHSNDFVRGVHSIGTLDPAQRYICHFPEDNAIISVNSNYGGNALQGKKCFALRMASILGKNQGWLAEHMLVLSITNPQGEKKYVAAAFPSGCGKTNLAMLIPPAQYREAGWKIQTIGDDIAWLNVGPDGRLYAINPEAGFFGIAPGTSYRTNPNAMETVRKNTIFTNTALNLDDMTPWWEGMSEPPARAKDWMNQEWNPDTPTKAAHPNARFTAPASQCPSIDPEWESPSGVPLSAIIFGGRRARTSPLVVEARTWAHGVFLGATMASETTAAAEGQIGQLRRDPMAMSPFLGYHVGEYFAHWLSFGNGAHRATQLPNVYHVNWFRTDANGKFMWPGFGENMRVLEWIFNRASKDAAPAIETPIGFQPPPEALNTEGLSISGETMGQLLAISQEDWREEIASQEVFFEKVGPELPNELWEEHRGLRSRLKV
jgi:phosphoenolpyruvate carboxykinase (GTP)